MKFLPLPKETQRQMLVHDGRKFRVSIVTVTVRLARYWLANHNKHNRFTSSTRVAKMASIQERGQWNDLTGETMIIDSDGNIISAQHRLAMILKTGIPVTTFLIEGIDPAHFKHVDKPFPRTLVSALEVEGEGEYSAEGTSQAAKDRYVRGVVGAINLVHNLFTKDVYTESTSQHSITDDESIQLLDRHPKIRESVNYVLGLVSKYGGGFGGPRMAGFHYVFSLIEEEKADGFFEGLYSGANLSTGDPVLTLRKQFLNMRNAPKSRKFPNDRKYKSFLVAKAWQHYYREEQIKLIRPTIPTSGGPTIAGLVEDDDPDTFYSYND